MSFKVLSYNTWLLPFWGAKDTKPRSKVLAQHLAQLDADIIALQEVWTKKFKLQLIEDFKKLGYVFSFFEDVSFSSLFKGIMGNGLLILSKHPIQIKKNLKDRVMAFSAFTRPDEYLARKGALHVQVEIPNLGPVRFYNTHLGAVSFNDEHSSLHPAQSSRHQTQLSELFQFIHANTEPNPIILAGDLNTHIKEQLNFKNFEDTHNKKQSSQIQKNSYDPITNFYIEKKKIFANGPARMLDYILSSHNEHFEAVDSQVVLHEAVDIDVKLTKRPLSDHYGILSHFKIIKKFQSPSE